MTVLDVVAAAAGILFLCAVALVAVPLMAATGNCYALWYDDLGVTTEGPSDVVRVNENFTFVRQTFYCVDDGAIRNEWAVDSAFRYDPQAKEDDRGPA